MIRLPVIALALLSLAAAPAVAPSPPGTKTPEAAAAGFYQAAISSIPGGGVPNTKALAKLRPFLTEDLALALVKAEKAEAHYAQRTKNEVPPLVEGDLFSSLTEGPTAVDGVRCTRSGQSARCKVQLRSDDTQGAIEPTRWTDHVILMNKDGWRINDIVYGASWEFGNKGNLRTLLNEVVRDADMPIN